MTKLVELGKVLKMYMDRNNIDSFALAKNIDVDADYVENVINGYERLSPQLAYKLGEVFDTGMKFWLKLQLHSDIDYTKEQFKDWQPKTFYIKDIFPFG